MLAPLPSCVQFQPFAAAVQFDALAVNEIEVPGEPLVGPEIDTLGPIWPQSAGQLKADSPGTAQTPSPHESAAAAAVEAGAAVAAPTLGSTIALCVNTC